MEPETPPIQKQAENLPTKRRMEKKVIVAVVMLVIMVTGSVVLTIAVKDYQDRVGESQTPPFTAADDRKLSSKTRYENSYLNFALAYPNEAKVKEPASKDANPTIYKIVYLGKNQLKPNPQETEINDGYIFKVVAHKNLSNVDIKSLAKEKLTTYTLSCPDLATISKLETKILNAKAAYEFEVLDCKVNYKESFVFDRGTVFELVQIYRGDLGFKQAYKSKEQEILDSFEFINIPSDEIKWVAALFHNPSFTINQPGLNNKCCSFISNLPGVPSRLVMLGDPASKVDAKLFDGFAVFYERNKAKKSFDEYLAEQKRLLIEDYRVVVGRNPSTIVEEKIKIGGVDAVSIKGYSWWAPQIVYLPAPEKQGFLVIVKNEASPGSFTENFNRILDSFVFLD